MLNELFIKPFYFTKDEIELFELHFSYAFRQPTHSPKALSRLNEMKIFVG